MPIEAQDKLKPRKVIMDLLKGRYDLVFGGKQPPGLWCLGFSSTGTLSCIQSHADVRHYVRFWVDMLSKLGLQSPPGSAEAYTLMEDMLNHHKEIHHVDRPLDLMDNIVNPWLAELCSLLSAKTHGWLRLGGTPPDIRHLIQYEDKAKVPRDWPDPVRQAACRLIDRAKALHHKSMSRAMGPPQSETKSLLDSVIARLERVERGNTKRPADSGQQNVGSKRPKAGPSGRLPVNTIRDYSRMYGPDRCFVADVAKIYPAWSKNCAFLSHGGKCTRRVRDRQTGQVTRVPVYHATEWAGTSGRLKPLTKQQLDDLKALLVRDNVPASPP